MTNQNPTAKQHFVPQFYLKRFADSEKNLHIYNVRERRLDRPRPYPGLGYGHYFYAAETGKQDEISQHVEHWLETYENIIAQHLPNIIKRILNSEHITDDDRYILSALMCMLWLRSPKMRDKLNRMHTDVTKQVMKLYASTKQIDKADIGISDADRKVFINMLKKGSYDIGFNNIHHLKLMTDSFGFYDKGFTNLFYGQKWKIFIARGDKHFITSDSPVVEWWLPPDSFYGASFLERNKYFALTPEIFIELSYPMGSSKIKRETLYSDDSDKVRMCNILLAAHSQNFAYSGEKELLEEMISGRAKPGRVEVAYYKQYDEPWAIYKKRQG